VGQISVLSVLCYSITTFIATPFTNLLHSHQNYLYQALIALSVGFIASLKEVILRIFNLSKRNADYMRTSQYSALMDFHVACTLQASIPYDSAISTCIHPYSIHPLGFLMVTVGFLCEV
jgi:hypothetical protein